MPMIIPFLPAIIGGVASIAGGALASGSKKTTSTTTPTLSPELQNAQTGNLNTLTGIRDSPGSGLEAIKSASQDSINRSYSALPGIATQKLASRGFGSSGQVGNAVYDTEGSRLSSLSGLEGQMAQLSSNRQLTASQIIEQMIHGGQGSSTVSTSPDQSLAGGLLSGGNALSNLTVLQTLQKMLANGGAMSENPGGNFGGVPGAGISIPDLLGSGAKGYPVDQTGWGN